jgi:hypothetical protein
LSFDVRFSVAAHDDDPTPHAVPRGRCLRCCLGMVR